jgi:hypothetical protein
VNATIAAPINRAVQYNHILLISPDSVAGSKNLIDL